MRAARRLGGWAVGVAAVLLTAYPANRLTAQQDTLRLTLADVLARVTVEHPIVRAGAAEVAAAVAGAGALRAYPNPSLEVDRTTFRSVDNLALLQRIRWPWESSALGDVGRAEVAVARADSDAALRTVLLEAADRFADGLRDERTLALAVEAESLAARGVA